MHFFPALDLRYYWIYLNLIEIYAIYVYLYLRWKTELKQPRRSLWLAERCSKAYSKQKPNSWTFLKWVCMLEKPWGKKGESIIFSCSVKRKTTASDTFFCWSSPLKQLNWLASFFSYICFYFPTNIIDLA